MQKVSTGIFLEFAKTFEVIKYSYSIIRGVNLTSNFFRDIFLLGQAIYLNGTYKLKSYDREYFRLSTLSSNVDVFVTCLSCYGEECQGEII